MAGRVAKANKRLERGNFHLPSPDEVIAAKSGLGGWSAVQLAEWGIAWPPRQGWRSELHARWEQQQPNREIDNLPMGSPIFPQIRDKFERELESFLANHAVAVETRCEVAIETVERLGRIVGRLCDQGVL